jgi:hypothetical protein
MRRAVAAWPAQRDHDRDEISFHGDLAVKYAENSSRDEKSPSKIGQKPPASMIVMSFRWAAG